MYIFTLEYKLINTVRENIIKQIKMRIKENKNINN